MTIWEALILGFVQGITEFFPISSSGHLLLAQKLLGMGNLSQHILFDLICHLGTLGAIFYHFSSSVKQLLASPIKKCIPLIYGTLPLLPLVFLLKPITALFDQPQYLGLCFLASAGLIFAGSKFKLKQLEPAGIARWQDPLLIGVFQAIAVLPGISRSGATISAAQMLGWNRQDAVHFSFLLAIPTILGGTFLQIATSSAADYSVLEPLPLVVGFLVSFGIGCASLNWLKHLIDNQKWVYFGWYCLFLGFITLII